MSRKTEWLLKPRYRMGPPPRSLAIDAQDCIMGRVKKTAGYKFAARTYARQEAGSTRIIFRTASPWVSLPPCSRPCRVGAKDCSSAHRVTGGGRPPPVPTERSVRISRTTLFGRCFTALQEPATPHMGGAALVSVTASLL